MEKFTERHFPTLIYAQKLRTETRETPINLTQPGKEPPRRDPCPAHSPPREGGGEVAQSGGGRPLGASDPLPAPLIHPFDRQWHTDMLRQCSSVLAPRIAPNTA
jgi:hypothetical protein